MKSSKRVLVVALVLAAVVFFLDRNITVTCGDSMVQLQAGATSDTIRYDELERVEWFADGVFLPGDGSGPAIGCLSGDYSGGSLSGTYRLYLDKGYTGKTLLIGANGQTYVVGSADLDMEALHDMLYTKMQDQRS